MSGEVKSIRRESFLTSFGILENEEEETGRHDSREGSHRNSFSIEDIEDNIDITFKHDNDNTSMGISLLEFGDDEDIDRHGSSFLPQSYHSRDFSEDPQASSKAPNFAGGSHRRRGSQQRRMNQRLGIKNDNRRASTGTNNMSIQESFGDMSLQSFTSVNSFSSSMGGGSGDQSSVQVGNLIFATDDEVATLMYGDDATNKTGENGHNSGGRRSSVSSEGSNLSASLPPSAMLGTGAFSTVRLAWRKTNNNEPNETKRPQLDSVETMPPQSLHNIGHADAERQHCRSIVRVKSQTSDIDPSNPPECNRELVAVKIIQKSILKQMKTMQKGPDNRMMVQTAFDNIEREIATMKRLKHPNLVRLFEVIDSVESDRLHMVLEYVSLGEILSHVEGTNKYTRMRYRKKVRGLTKSGHFDEKHAALYFVDIMHGLAYLHRNRICHRDLKPENILLCENGIAKISDFGVSHMFEEEKVRESYMLTALEDDFNDSFADDFLSDCDDIDDSMSADNEKGDPTLLTKRESDSAFNMSSRYDRGMLKKTEGTWCFWSPEMCSTDSKGFSGYACDLWAAGVCLYIFTTGTLPFFSLMPSDLFELIAEAEVDYDRLDLSNELKDLLGKLLTKDVSARAGVGDCLKHKFCSDARIERIDEMGNKFMDSEEHIILSKTDVEMALSVTMNNIKRPPRKISKRFSAPCVQVDPFPDPTPDPPVTNTSPSKVKNNPNLATLTENSVDNSSDYTPCNTASATEVKKNSNLSGLTAASAGTKAANPSDTTHSAGSNVKAKQSTTKVGLGSKFKLKSLWQRRR